MRGPHINVALQANRLRLDEQPAPSPQPRARRVDLIVVTCTGTPNGLRVEPEAIDAQHAQRGLRREDHWRRRQNPALEAIGFHFLIQPNGALHTGRHLDEIGQHTRGHNTHSVCTCLVGCDRYTEAAWRMLARNVEALLGVYPGAKVVGKDHFSQCLRPGFPVAAWLHDGMQIPSDGVLMPAAEAAP